MTTETFLDKLNHDPNALQSREMREKLAVFSQEAIRITMQINTAYHTPAELRALMEQLTGQALDAYFCLFPPFYTDCGKNIHLGRGVFINAGCKLQDQGGIWIGDGCLLGHGVTIATLNHGLTPDERRHLYPKPVHLGQNVWLGAGAIVLPGVTIGENTVIGAGSVVTKDIPQNVVAVGNPARVLREIG